MHGIRDLLPPPAHDGGHAQTGEHSDRPTQEEEQDLGPGGPPVPSHHVRDRGRGEDTEHDARESENLRDGAAQDSANRERGDEDEDDPVGPRQMLDRVQRVQLSCVRRAMFLRLAAFSLRLRRSLGFSKC